MLEQCGSLHRQGRLRGIGGSQFLVLPMSGQKSPSLAIEFYSFSTQCPYLALSSVKFSLSVMSYSLQPHGLQHARLPCPSPTPRAYSNSCPLNWWCHLTISSSVVPFSSCLQSFPTIRAHINILNFTSPSTLFWCFKAYCFLLFVRNLGTYHSEKIYILCLHHV